MPLFGRTQTKFADLPSEVRKNIQSIIKHRHDYSGKAVPFWLMSSVVVPFSWVLLPPFGVALAVTTTVAGYDLHHSHDQKFRAEYIRLVESLAKNKSHPAIQELLSNQNANYIIVKNNGNLQTRRSAPRIGKLPIGRRRIENPERNPQKRFKQLPEPARTRPKKPLRGFLRGLFRKRH